MSSHDHFERPPRRPVGHHRWWTWSRQDAAAVMWPSFLSAGALTTLFFAVFDPLLLGDISTPPIDLTRMAGYAWGFFMFWGFTFTSSLVTLFMLRTVTRTPDNDNGRDE